MIRTSGPANAFATSPPYFLVKSWTLAREDDRVGLARRHVQVLHRGPRLQRCGLEVSQHLTNIGAQAFGLAGEQVVAGDDPIVPTRRQQGNQRRRGLVR